MNKLLKLVVMAIIMLAIVAVSINVNAYTTDDLIAHLGDEHNGYKLDPRDQAALEDYLKGSNLDETAVNSIVEDLQGLKDSVGDKGLGEIDDSILTKAQAIAKKAGLNVTFDTVTGVYTVATKDGTPLASLPYGDSYNDADTNNPTEDNATDSTEAEKKSDAKTDEKSSKAKKLLYTGADSFVYVLPLLAIVAVAIVAKKRA